MKKDPLHIKFKNHQNPKSDFDIIKIKELFYRKELDHSPEELHLVEFYMVLFVTNGKGKHTIDFTDYTCKKGTILTIRKNQLHKFIKSNLDGNILLFTDNFLVSYLEKLEATKTLQLFNDLLAAPQIQLSTTEYNEINLTIARITDEYFKLNDDYSLGIIRSELHILITKLFRIKSNKTPIIKNRKYLNEFVLFQELIEKNITQVSKVLDYAKMMGISSKTLNTICRNIINKSAKEFIDEIYIKQIKRLLINTDHSVKEIAYISGFTEIPNFHKYFKRHTSYTPEQFRQLSS